MKNKDLIEKLLALPPDAEIVALHDQRCLDPVPDRPLGLIFYFSDN